MPHDPTAPAASSRSLTTTPGRVVPLAKLVVSAAATAVVGLLVGIGLGSVWRGAADDQNRNQNQNQSQSHDNHDEPEPLVLPYDARTDKYAEDRIYEGKFWVVYASPKQYYLGRLVLWSKRPAGTAAYNKDVTTLSRGERRELWALMAHMKRALHQWMQPDVLNYAVLANDAKHIHMHIIPRYASPRTFAGEVFEDEKFGHNYSFQKLAVDPTTGDTRLVAGARKKISADVRRQIVQCLTEIVAATAAD